jgi:hypothetical protein
MALKAILWPTASVLHIVNVDKPPRDFFPNFRIIEFKLDVSQVKKIVAYFSERLKRDGKERSIYMGKSRYGRGKFFLGTEKFHLFKTCNTWTGRALKQGGIPVSTFMLITAGSLYRRAQKHGKQMD